MTPAIVGLLCLLPLVTGLTEAEAAKWTTHIKNNLFQGAANKKPVSTRRNRDPPPAYMHSSWWEGEVQFDDAPQDDDAPSFRSAEGRVHGGSVFASFTTGSSSAHAMRGDVQMSAARPRPRSARRLQMLHVIMEEAMQLK